jgi:hypothetical protein
LGLLHSDLHDESRDQGDVVPIEWILRAVTVLICRLRLSQADLRQEKQSQAEIDGKVYRMSLGADAYGLLIEHC